MIMQIGAIDKSNLAETDDEFRQLVESDVDWIARSADDVEQLRQAQFGPFGKLSEDDFREFLASLEFRQFESNRPGLATGSYKPLMRSLSLTELFEVFECFGMSIGLMVDTRDQRCDDGVCIGSFGDICSIFCEGNVPV
jgi:hypothetical protein